VHGGGVNSQAEHSGTTTITRRPCSAPGPRKRRPAGLGLSAATSASAAAVPVTPVAGASLRQPTTTIPARGVHARPRSAPGVRGGGGPTERGRSRTRPRGGGRAAAVVAATAGVTPNLSDWSVPGVRDRRSFAVETPPVRTTRAGLEAVYCGGGGGGGEVSVVENDVRRRSAWGAAAGEHESLAHTPSTGNDGSSATSSSSLTQLQHPAGRTVALHSLAVGGASRALSAERPPRPTSAHNNAAIAARRGKPSVVCCMGAPWPIQLYSRSATHTQELHALLLCSGSAGGTPSTSIKAQALGTAGGFSAEGSAPGAGATKAAAATAVAAAAAAAAAASCTGSDHHRRAAGVLAAEVWTSPCLPLRACLPVRLPA
jgi:hypothetical protein